MRLWIRNPDAIWSPGGAEHCGAGLVVQGRHIVECVAAGQQPAQPVDAEWDAGGRVLLPGLINTHHHFYQTLTRAVPQAQDRELFDWLRALYPIWAELDSEDIAQSTRLALAELLLSGCTTSADHHYVFTGALAEAIDVQAEVAASLGVRVTLTRGSMSLGESAGGLPPDSVTQSAADIARSSEALIQRYHDASPGAMCQLALAPCSPFSVTGEVMRDAAAIARAHGVRLHTHLGETEDENAFCLAEFGKRPLDYLDDVGWLDSDVWLAHGIHFSDDEIGLLGAAGVCISHCPSSNMFLASGICRGLELEAAGAGVSLGVDGSASNDHSNLMQEVRQAFLLQRLRYGSERVSARQVLTWATLGGARALGREGLGVLEPGALADLALYSLDELRFAGCADPVSALVTSGASQASDVMVNGEWRVVNGEIPGLDVAALRADQDARTQRLLSAS